MEATMERKIDGQAEPPGVKARASIAANRRPYGSDAKMTIRRTSIRCASFEPAS
jgi:hypothetical protein